MKISEFCAEHGRKQNHMMYDLVTDDGNVTWPKLTYYGGSKKCNKMNENMVLGGNKIAIRVIGKVKTMLETK
jgi:hypothetical protein